MIKREVTICNKLGLHARASSKLAQTASQFGSKISIGQSEDQLVDCKSIMALMMQAAGIGSRMVLITDGDDEESAADAICALIEDKFGEGE
jgi:phosphocarrier protein HPr